MAIIRTHEDLLVFQNAIDAAVDVFHACKLLPASERHLLANQWLRASRSVAANIAELWRKRYYRAHFMSKISDVEAEAAECQVWALLAHRYGYLDKETSDRIRKKYDAILGQLITMSRDANKWVYDRKPK